MEPDPLPPNLNSYPAEARKISFLSTTEMFDAEAGRLRWKKESDFFATTKVTKDKGPRPAVWPVFFFQNALAHTLSSCTQSCTQVQDQHLILYRENEQTGRILASRPLAAHRRMHSCLEFQASAFLTFRALDLQPNVDWIMKQVETAVFSNAYEYQASWWQVALEHLGKVRLQTVKSFEQDGTKRDYPVEYLTLDPSDGIWKSPLHAHGGLTWRGKKRFMRLVELRLNWEELVDEFHILEEWCRLDTNRSGTQTTRRYVHGEDVWLEAQGGGKTKGRNVAKRVVDWSIIVQELVGLRVDEFDPLSPPDLQLQLSEVRMRA